jgi:hypothetical protein
MCVHTALNPLNSPAVGWVTTTRAEVKILPPPTGISLVVVSAPLPPAWPVPAPVPVPALPLEAVPLAAGAEPPPHAASVPARPARPTPAIRPRRVVLASGGWVTGDPPG